MTEREWRKSRRKNTRPDWWGPQLVLPPVQKTLHQDRSFQFFLITLSCCIAVLLPVLVSEGAKESFADIESAACSSEHPRSVSAVRYERPALVYEQHTATAGQLLGGKLLLLNDRFSLPQGVPAPNTFSVATQGRGMVPVRSLQVKSGRETVSALLELFGMLREAGVNGLCVWQGTQSAKEQQAMRLADVRKRMLNSSISEAVQETLAFLEMPGTGEMVQEYTVELRFLSEKADVADGRRLEDTPQGQTLLQLAWRCGLIRSQPDASDRHAFRFRYVGKAHATAMTYLDLNLESYLNWLHEKQAVTIYSGGKPQYLILCQPVEGSYVTFQLPRGAECELSLDNMGYAVAACTL